MARPRERVTYIFAVERIEVPNPRVPFRLLSRKASNSFGMAQPTSITPLRPTIDALEPRLLMTATQLESAPATPGVSQPAMLAPQSDLLLPAIHDVTGVSYAHEQYGLTGSGQTVVIIDSGVAYDHPALGGGLGTSYRVVGGWDFTEENDADPYDDGPAGYHGTHVAGILASNDTAHLGVAPEVDIVALRVFNDVGRGKLSWLESSLQWVIDNRHSFDHPITTVNMSIGTKWSDVELPDYADLENELHELKQAGIFVSVAAGNRFGADVGLSYPAVSPYAVPAASSNAEGQLSDFSQRHSSALVVPGQSITSTVPDYLTDFNGKTDDFYTASGTSMAAPYLAGVSLLVRQAMEQNGVVADGAVVDAIYEVLSDTADSVFDPATGQHFQHVNVRRAIDAIMAERVVERPEIVQPDIVQPDVVPSNVVKQTDRLIVTGTTGDDEILIDQGGSVRFNGTLHDFDPRQIQTIEVSGDGGNDRLTVEVREAESIVSLTTNSLIVSSGRVSITGEGFERTNVMVRADGVVANFEGSAGKDELNIKPTHSWMSHDGTTNYVQGATRVVGRANDASDTVMLYDGAGDDVFNATSASATLDAGDFTAEVSGYETYLLRAQNGGHDEVTLVGTAGNDVARAKTEFVSLFTDEYFVYASGFETRHIIGEGGKDTARIYDSQGNDQLNVRPGSDTLQTSQNTTNLLDFQRVEAFASAGIDTVTYLGGDDDEVFVAKPTHSWARFRSSLHYAKGFDTTVIDAAGGDDSVWLYDSLNDDQFQLGRARSTARGIGFEYIVINSEHVHAISQYGNDLAVLDRSAGDRLFAESSSTWIRGAEHTVIADGFRRVESGSLVGHDDAFEFLASEWFRDAEKGVS